jgi:hypothetical protein
MVFGWLEGQSGRGFQKPNIANLSRELEALSGHQFQEPS